MDSRGFVLFFVSSCRELGVAGAGAVDLGFRVLGLGFRVLGLRFRV